MIGIFEGDLGGVVNGGPKIPKVWTFHKRVERGQKCLRTHAVPRGLSAEEWGFRARGGGRCFRTERIQSRQTQLFYVAAAVVVAAVLLPSWSLDVVDDGDVVAFSFCLF